MNVIELERIVIIAYAAAWVLAIAIAVVLSLRQYRKNKMLKREIAQLRELNKLDADTQAEIVQKVIRQNKLNGLLDTILMARQIVVELNKGREQ